MSRGIKLAGAGLLYSRAAMSLVSATAASETKTRSSTASEVAAYTARLQLLQVALHQNAKAVLSSSSTATGEPKQSSTGVALLSHMSPPLMNPAACKLHTQA